SHSEPAFQISRVYEQPVTMNLVEVTHQGGSSTPPNPVVPVEVPSDKIISDPLTHIQTENLIRGDTLVLARCPGPAAVLEPDKVQATLLSATRICRPP
ncbi:MAG TPA: hypothetical protein VKA08_06140, partial [Balneolales bacterium]|nr:hypothetical protein [Balneolales bacterium]